ncbi:unnamed protein product [Urochloa humidicola]
MAFRRLFSLSPTTTTTPTAPSFSDVLDEVLFGPGGIFPISREFNAEPKLPIHVDDRPDTEPKRKAKGRRRADDPMASMAKAAPPVSAARRRTPSAEAAAAVRLQAAARGFLARRSVQVVREVERKAEAVEHIVRQRGEELRRGSRSARVAVAEALMRMLLRLDAVRGAREYRRRVTRKVLALQDAVDALEPKAPAPAGEATAEDEIVAPVLTPQDAVETKAVPATGAEPEVAAAEEEAEPASGGGANREDDKPEGSDADAEWEILEEEEPAAAEARHHDPGHPAGQETAGAADAGAGAVDTGKLMEMVAALCEWNAEQRALIGALAERVDALERTVRRMEDAERRGLRDERMGFY